jgi:hypothetical protein
VGGQFSQNGNRVADFVLGTGSAMIKPDIGEKMPTLGGLRLVNRVTIYRPIWLGE